MSAASRAGSASLATKAIARAPAPPVRVGAPAVGSRSFMIGSRKAPGLAAGHAHMARYRRALVAPIDDEVVTLGLARDRRGDRAVEQRVVGARPQRRAQIGRILLAQAHEQRAGAGHAHAVA